MTCLAISREGSAQPEVAMLLGNGNSMPQTLKYVVPKNFDNF